MRDGKEVALLPEGWTRIPLGSCVDVLDRLRKPVNSTERAKRTGDVPYYGATGQVGWIDDYLFDEELVLLGEDGAPFFDKSKPIAYIVDGPSWVNNHAHVLRARSPIANNKYIKYFLDSFDFSDSVQGSTRDKLTQRAMKAIPVALAPPPEQQRIADRIDALEDRRASAQVHLRRGRALLEAQRSAVLSAACDGRLTEDWRDISVDASELPAGWIRESVEALAASLPRSIQSGPFGSNLKHSEFQPNGKLVIGIDNVRDGEFSLGSQHRISDRKFKELARYEARPHDVLITVMGTVGRVCVVPADIEPAIITKHVYRITVDPERVLPEFLALALRGHRTVREQIHHQTRGQTRPGINGQIVKSLIIALPPRDEQAAIVTRAKALLASASRLAERIDRCAALIDASSRAALDKAFRGELVVTEAALAEQEGRNLEPAQVPLTANAA